LKALPPVTTVFSALESEESEKSTSFEYMLGDEGVAQVQFGTSSKSKRSRGKTQ
jgi:hypothetical protein